MPTRPGQTFATYASWWVTFESTPRACSLPSSGSDVPFAETREALSDGNAAALDNSNEGWKANTKYRNILSSTTATIMCFVCTCTRKRRHLEAHVKFNEHGDVPLKDDNKAKSNEARTTPPIATPSKTTIHTIVGLMMTMSTRTTYTVVLVVHTDRTTQDLATPRCGCTSVPQAPHHLRT